MKTISKTHQCCTWTIFDINIIGHLKSYWHLPSLYNILWQVLMLVDLVSVGQVESPHCHCFSANFLCKIVKIIIIVMNNIFEASEWSSVNWHQVKRLTCSPSGSPASPNCWLRAWSQHIPVNINTSLLSATSSASIHHCYRQHHQHHHQPHGCQFVVIRGLKWPSTFCPAKYQLFLKWRI